LQAVWRARDGVLPPTRLTEHFVQRAGCADVEALFHACYRREITYDDLFPMAKLVFDAALEGDSAACDILAWGGRYLGEMVNACARKLAMQGDHFEVVTAGSVFKGSSPVLADTMRAVIHRECPHATTTMPLFEPVVGALLLGMELDHEITGEIYATLSASLLEAEKAHGVKLYA
jgi:N-acetylglucosamine kinase-like BadF-type ATPase